MTALPIPTTGAPLVYPGDRIVYYCSQVVAEASCGVSRDGGNSLAYSTPTYTIPQRLVGPVNAIGCAGLHGHLRVAPNNGFAYLPNFGCNSQDEPEIGRPAIIESENDGLTWTTRRVPDTLAGNFDSDPSVAVDAGGTVYLAIENRTGNMELRTFDQGTKTFSAGTDIGAVMGLKNTTFPAVIAGSAGRAAVAYLGTPTEAPLNNSKDPENQLFAFDPDGNDPQAGWHAYVSMTYDGGATWTTTDITPTDPVQRGCIWWGSAIDSDGLDQCANNKRNLLDFNDIAVDNVGRVVFGFADGCVGTCVGDATRNTNTVFADRPAEDMDLTRAQFDELYSQRAVGTIGRQSCGMGLFEEFDTDPAGPLLTCQRLASPSEEIPEVPFVPGLVVGAVLAGAGGIYLSRRRTAQV